MLFSYQSKSSAPSIVWVSESVFLRELRLRNIGKLERQVGLVYPTFTMYSQTARQLRDRTRRPRKSRLKTVYSSSSAAAPVTIEIGISLSPALQFRAHTHTRSNISFVRISPRNRTFPRRTYTGVQSKSRRSTEPASRLPPSSAS